MFYTYAHYKPGTNEIFYIGKGSGNRAFVKIGRNDRWNKVAKKYDFEVVILQTWITEKAAFDHEVQLIEYYRGLKQAYCNLTDGGEGASGCKLPERSVEHRKKLSLANSKPRPKSFSENRTGSKNPHFKGAIIATCLVSGEEKMFCGDKELLAAGFIPSNVVNCVNHGEKHKTHKGHTFRRNTACLL